MLGLPAWKMTKTIIDYLYSCQLISCWWTIWLTNHFSTKQLSSLCTSTQSWSLSNKLSRLKLSVQYTQPLTALLLAINRQLRLSLVMFDTNVILQEERIQMHKYKGLIYSHPFPCLLWTLTIFLLWGLALKGINIRLGGCNFYASGSAKKDVCQWILTKR